MKLNQVLGLIPRSLVERIELLTQRLPAPAARRLLVQMAVRLQK
jgi:hypothetical protein